MSEKPRKRRATEPPPAGSRAERIVEMARAGRTVQSIADELGITKGGAGSVLTYYQVSTGNPPGGQSRKRLDEDQP